MTGQVNGLLEAVVDLRLRGPAGETDIESVIDTGFSDFLLLPESILATLGTVARRQTEAVLGDGSEVPFDLHFVDVLWNGKWLAVRAFAGGETPLLGVSLLEGSRLVVDFVPGGEVRVEGI